MHAALHGVPCSQSSKKTRKLDDQNDPAGYTTPLHSPVIKLCHVAQLFTISLQQNPLGALGWHWVRRVRLGKAEPNGAHVGEADVAVGEVGGIVHKPVHAQDGMVMQV